MTEKTKLCKDCVNFLVEDNKATCDYEYWIDVNIYKAYIYVPDMFDCIEWEQQPE